MNSFNLFGRSPATKPGDPSNSEASIELAKLVTLIESSVRSMQSQMESLNSRIDQVVSSIGGQGNPSPPKPDDEPPASRLQGMSEEELEQLSRRELLALQQEELTRVVTGAMKDLLTPFNERLTGVEQTTGQTRVQTELEKFTSASVDGKPKYPDWKDYAPSMKEILAKTKGISIFDAYTMAKARLKETDPNKYAEIEDKYFPKDPGTQPFSYGGQRTVSHSSPTKEINMDLDDAMEATAREFQELHGPIPDLN